MSARLLAITDAGCPASTRYRVTQFESYLQSKSVQLQTLAWSQDPSDIAKLRELASQADIVLFQRYLPGPALIRAIRRRSRRLIYDFDDAIIYSESTRLRPRLQIRRAWRFRQMMRCCDAVTAGNDYLAGIARRYAPPHSVHIIPTAVEADKYSSSFAGSEASSTTSPIIGWIGSRSTLPYLEMLRHPLARLSELFPGLTVHVIADQRPNLGTVKVELIPWQAETEARELQRLTVGLAPLPDDSWTRGKCGLRLLQYLAAGVPAVASPVGTQSVIASRGAALTATSDDDWIDAMTKLLTQPDLRATLVTAGANLVCEHFDVPVVARSVHKVWCGTS